jgi:predicted nuclease of predicted toxin-antitoxin system
MATIYKIELVSHWVNFSEKELQRLLEQAIKQVKEFTNNGNEITIEVKERN